MRDDTPLQIISFALLSAALSLIPYLLSEARSSFGKRRDLSAVGFSALAGTIFLVAAVCLTILGPEYLLVSTALACGFGFSLVHPVASICFFVSLLFLRPWEFLPNNPLLSILPRLMAAVTAGCWCVGALRTQRTAIVVGGAGYLFAALLGWIAVSCLASITPGASLESFFESFAPTCVLSFLIVNSLKTTNDLNVFLRSFIISGAGILSVAFYITYRDYMSGASDFRLHSSGLWGNSNDLAALAVLMLPFSFFSLLSRAPGTSRLISVAATIVFTAALLWSQSRAAQGAVIIAGLIYIILCGGGIRLALALLPAVIVVAIIAAAMPQRDAADTEGSSESRYNYVIAGLRMTRAHPLFGVGVGNYPYLYEQYTPAFVETGNRTAHSSWILILSETGIGGFLLLTLLYASVTRQAFRLKKTAPQYALSAVTYGIAMSFLSHTYLFLPYVFMAFILAAARASRAVALICTLFLFAPQARADNLIYLGAQVGMNKPLPGENRVTESAITVKGSRGEVLTFLLKLEGEGCFPLSISWDDPKASMPAVQVAFFDLPEVTTVQPSYTGARTGQYLDPVVALPEPNRVCVTSGSRSRWLLGEVTITRESKPGVFKGSISAGPRAVSLTLAIWPMTIPTIPALPAYSELTPWFLVLAHHGKWHEDEPLLANRYSSMMLDHRMIPLKSNIAPLKEVDGLPQPTLDLDRSPSSASSFSSVVLRNRPDWAYYDFPTVGANGTKAIDYAQAEKYFTAIQNSIPSIKRDDKALVYLWDEPKKDAFAELLKLSRLVKRTAPLLKQLVTTPYAPDLKDTVDIFSPVINQFDTAGYPPPSIYQDLRTQGHEVWWYVSCMSHGCEALMDTMVPDMVIDRPSSYIRSIGWLSMRYSVDAYLYYSVNNGFQFAPTRDPWRSLWDFSGNGDGTLFYPGRPGEHGLSTHQPIPSLRLKLWRESSFDAEYIKWMNSISQKPNWWPSELHRIAQSTTVWERDYSAYTALRDKIGEYLSSQHDT